MLTSNATVAHSSAKRQRFLKTLFAFYEREGRHHLPWRKTKNPYRILVSEIMLQQTQVDRVLPKYQTFVRQFPSVNALAAASLGDVLIAWQGLGYNRRAKHLKAAAEAVVAAGGRFPKTYDGLKALPGVGSYTAAAVMAFAYNQPVPLLETNVRTVLMHHFWPTDATDVSDTELLELVAKLLPQNNARHFYAAMMDYGSYLKRTVGNHSARTKSYQKQSVFKGSDRQIRGVIVRALTTGPLKRDELLALAPKADALRVDAQLAALVKEGMVVTAKRNCYTLP